MGFQEIKAPLMDENGTTSSTCSTQQYLTEAVEQEIEKAGIIYRRIPNRAEDYRLIY